MRFVATVALSLSLALCLYTFVSSKGWRAHQQRAHQLETLRQENDAKRKHADFLHAHIQGLRKRADVQEHVIRDELGYVRAEDVVIDFSAKK